MMLLCVVYVLAGLLIAGISWPLIVGKIPPNSWYGFRTPRTLRDPAIWYPANAYAGRWLFGCGIIVALAAVALYFIPAMNIESYGYSMLAITLLTIGSALVQSFRFLSGLPSR